MGGSRAVAHLLGGMETMGAHCFPLHARERSWGDLSWAQPWAALSPGRLVPFNSWVWALS